MGLFARLTHSEGRWHEAEPQGEPYLTIDVHDSDIATVDYRPAMTATGRFYLGVEPRYCFEDEDANRPVNRQVEADGFSRWVHEVHGREVDPSAVLALMAPDVESDEPDDEGDVFVEETADRLLGLIGLPPAGWYDER